MKYKAQQLNNGNYAVFSGKSYYPETITLDEKEAKKEALKMSAQWYYQQAEKAWALAEKDDLLGKYDTCLGDWLC
jgi:hypothetical protein